MVVTLVTLQCSRGFLNVDAPENIFSMVITLATFHPLMSSLKSLWCLNRLDMSVTYCVSHMDIGPCSSSAADLLMFHFFRAARIPSLFIESRLSTHALSSLLTYKGAPVHPDHLSRMSSSKRHCSNKIPAYTTDSRDASDVNRNVDAMESCAFSPEYTQ